MTIAMDHPPEDVGYGAGQSRFKTIFTGKHGRVLAEATGTSAEYKFRGDEGYVRAVITDSDGRKAWTQPMFLDSRSPVRP